MATDDDYLRLLGGVEPCDESARRLLEPVGFTDWHGAMRRLRGLCRDDRSRSALAASLPALLAALAEAAAPDASLVNFERLVRSVPEPTSLFEFLARNPRAVEILVRLFVGSQFLTEVLLRNPAYLGELTNHKRLAEFKSRQQFYQQALNEAQTEATSGAQLDALRRYQRGELLRIGACDAFGLLDLRSVTVQLSLLADALVQACLTLLSADSNAPTDGFTVLAFGKLGGEELNYSSDIDLVFVCQDNAERYLPLGQRLIRALHEPTAEGFLYRVDMRLRPWGRSGPLVNTVAAHAEYLQRHGQPWEKQALLKARPIAGNLEAGEEFLRRVSPGTFDTPVEVLRRDVREMKARIEAELERQGRAWGEVKAGRGSLRDIEFVTQFLQLAHGRAHPEVRSINTVDALVRLADFGFLQADEYRHLTGGYVFLRTIEHALQLAHHKQSHTLPSDPRELAYLARRLDFPDAAQFLQHYEQHCAAIRTVFNRYLGAEHESADSEESAPPIAGPEKAPATTSYTDTFSGPDRERHAALISRLSGETPAAIDARAGNDGEWRVTVAGYDYPGALSAICGLLFVHGFDIVSGHAFSDEYLPASVPRPATGPGSRRRFLDVFTVRPDRAGDATALWTRYEEELRRLLREIAAGRSREAQGRLAKQFAAAVREPVGGAAAMSPVEIETDNQTDPRATVLHIRSDDTMGFLYELSNALALTGIDIGRVVIDTVGSRVFDTLHVTDVRGRKLSDAAHLTELRAAVVLIKHFTHLLPRSPNPESALLHFRELLQQPRWIEDLAALERTDVLDALARLLGVSDFLWEDFLRLQHENLFPVVRDPAALDHRKSRDQLAQELEAALATAETATARRTALNAFKDREMFRTDMRHILGRIEEFGEFSRELTDVAETVVEAARRICDDELYARFGAPRTSGGAPCRLCLCALGKFGGGELGFASDIELMFVYDDDGLTGGPERVSAGEYFAKLAECFSQAIEARREGVFEVDLRLRPYGRAGSLAVSRDAFRAYFAAGGAAWPYERQALVKLRPVAGDAAWGREVVALRDALIYSGEPFDAASMRAMRERQIRQLVRPGTFNAKLSPGGLADCEYLVQGLQIAHGHRSPALRATNTLDAMDALRRGGILRVEDHAQLRAAYILLRRVIDALRMVRGHARDLTVPAVDSEEFEFLARRLRAGDAAQLRTQIDDAVRAVQDVAGMLAAPP